MIIMSIALVVGAASGYHSNGLGRLAAGLSLPLVLGFNLLGDGLRDFLDPTAYRA